MGINHNDRNRLFKQEKLMKEVKENFARGC